MTKSSLPLVALAAALTAPASAQYAAAPANDADRLAAEMRVIGANPTDVVALTEAGELSTRLGDLSGAASLFARADKVDPRNGRVKAGMAGVLLHLERPGEALLFYNQAEGYGYPVARFAADRALAYDLVAQQGRAQRDYRLALAGGAADDETVRRYALSLGISGQKEAALQQLDPLLRRNDRAGWRARAFVLAMNGEAGAASTIATTMMAPGQASGMAAFFARLPALGPADRAFAVQFGELRPTPQRLADLRLAPALPMLASEIVPVARAAPPVQVAVARVDKRKRGRKGVVQLAVVAPLPVAPPLLAPPAYGARPLANGPAIAARAPLPGFGVGVPPSRTPVAALATRTLPPSYSVGGQLNRSPVTVAALAPRVLPARSPLPPPPVLVAPERTDLARQSAPAGPTQTAVVSAPPPLAATRPAPIVLAQAAARTERFVAIERPGSLLSGYVRVPSITRPPVVAVARPTIAPQLARVTGTLSSPAPTPAVTPQMSAPVASATVPERVALASTPPPIQAGIVVPQRADSAPELTAPAAPPRDTGQAAAAVTSVLSPPPPSQLARAELPATSSVATGASLSDGAPPRVTAAPPLSAGALAPRDTVSGAGVSAPSTGVASPVSGPVPTMVTTAVPPTAAAPVAGVPVTAAARAAGTLIGPSLDTGVAPTTALTPSSSPAVPAMAADPSGDAAAELPAAAVSSPVPADPIASGEPAGVAVTSALPARDGALAGIIAALPVPASELNIAPVVAVPKRPAPDPAQETGSGTAQPRTAAARHDLSDAAHEDSSTRSPRHKSPVADQLASSAHAHGAPASDDGAPVAKGKARQGNAVAEVTPPKTRKGAIPPDTPASGKGRHATLAKADEDDTAPVRGKHGRHDAPDDERKTPTKTGRKALAARHEAEPQKYWVQVAGGANEASLGKAWQIARGKAPALAGRKGYTAPLHATNRVLAGPFKSDDEARQFVNTLHKQGVNAFQFTNDKGQKVKKLDDE